jgi:hypothetical protein
MTASPTAGQVTIHGHSGRSLRGVKIITGTVQLSGGTETPIPLASYCTAVLTGIVSIRSTEAHNDPVAVTCSPSGTTLNVYAWKDDSDPTMAASDNDTFVVDFFVTVKA